MAHLMTVGLSARARHCAKDASPYAMPTEFSLGQCCLIRIMLSLSNHRYLDKFGHA